MGFFSALFGNKDSNRLAQAMKEGAFLVDVRTPAEFSAGSVKGAVNIPLDKIRDEAAKFKDRKNIVVFCRSGSRSGQARQILEQKGFKDVINGGTWRKVNNLITQKHAGKNE